MFPMFALRSKACAFLVDDHDDDDYEKSKIINSKAKRTKKMCNKT